MKNKVSQKMESDAMADQAGTGKKNILENKKALIFDFDGTIADTLPLHEAAFIDTLREYRLTFNYRDYLGISTSETLKRIFKINNRGLAPEELDMLTTKKRSATNKLYSSINFIPGAFEFIKLAYQHRFDMFIGSSGSPLNIHTGLRSLGIDKYFKGIFTSGDVSNSKPQPDIFLKILATYNIDPAMAIVIEDAESGIAAASAAGIDVVCIDDSVQLRNSYKTFIGFMDFNALTAQLAG